MKPLIAVVLCAALASCSSGNATSPPLEDEPGEIVRYEAIAGSWSGWDYSSAFAFRVEISDEAPVGERVGSFNVLQATETDLVPYCAIVMKASSAAPPDYVFDGSAGSCTPTSLSLRHNVDDERIELRNSHGEAGYLIRGSDPGPPPE